MENASTRRHGVRVNRVGAPSPKSQNSPGVDRSRYFALIAQDYLLAETVRFLTSVGLPRSGIARKLRALAGAVEGGSDSLIGHSDDLELFSGVSGVVHDWTRSPEYTGRDGEPKALPVRGRNGLAVLIRNRLPRANIGRALRWMSKRGVIHRRVDGRYVLQQQRTVFVSTSLYLEWAATHAMHHLKTALENSKQSNMNARQVDRLARVFHLPEQEVPKFREFAKSRAESCIEEIDNWLEDHNAPNGRKRTVEAGVHVYGYIEDAQKNGRKRLPGAVRSALNPVRSA